MTNESEMQNSTKEFFEAEPTDLPAGIMVNGLRKEFKGLTGTNVLAVDSVSFKVKVVNSLLNYYEIWITELFNTYFHEFLNPNSEYPQIFYPISLLENKKNFKLTNKILFDCLKILDSSDFVS